MNDIRGFERHIAKHDAAEQAVLAMCHHRISINEVARIIAPRLTLEQLHKIQRLIAGIIETKEGRQQCAI